MLEIEAKIKVGDFTAVQKRLKRVGASPLKRRRENNIFFDTSNRKLLAADSGLRLRRNHDLKTKKDEYVLTFKGPGRPGTMKKRDERELVVESEKDAIALLKGLGYAPILRFGKHRSTWRLGKCEIALDEVAGLGKFVEVEGPGVAVIKKVLDKIGLGEQPHVRESYAAMLAKKKR